MISPLKPGGNPALVIGAVFIAPKVVDPNDRLRVHQCLGTAFLVSGYSFDFLTAKHVVDTELKDTERMILVLNRPGGFEEFEVNKLNTTLKSDIAFGNLEISEGVNLDGFEVQKGQYGINANIVSIEHSATGGSDGADGTIFAPRFRKGYIVSTQISKFGNTSGSKTLEVSYPALRGASGAPVFIENTLKVVGMMVENVDHELAPTQLIRALDENGELVEEIKYVMPHGIAIASESLSEILHPFVVK